MVLRSSSFDPTDLVAGVDTHTDTHTLAILTAQGGTVLTQTFTADMHGYADLITALRAAGHVAVVGVEGTNSYGAGLTRALRGAGYAVKEVLRPARQVRRMRGKSDPIEAIEAARTVISGHGVSDAKDTQTATESLRFLLTARAQLISTMTALGNSITSMLITAPETVRAKYRGLATPALIKRLTASRPGEQCDSPHTAALHAMRQLARAREDASSKAEHLEQQMRQLLATHYPQVLAIYGAGTIVAAQLVVTAGGNPQRIRNEAAFASLCGVAPIPASSGRTNRHRLNRGGDRRGNSALHRITLIRMQRDKRTQDYVARRTREGKSTKEIMRCLKRAIAREVYRALTAEQSPATQHDFKALRESKRLTLSQAAAALRTQPARISDIEKQRRPLPELTARYKQWLEAA
ncbi:IS110 family transposase [Crystallibacter degradans]|uniref:IS110 family transposase n=1 Tax=Crystallibacter degradans TaxID=2726743 RepID=UPI001474D21A|nr:IS110 family transposase [Arthrobacter sp. SF27]NMR31850.1 IS110 family transposase [Arthrobacter sp. SF27]